MKLFALEVIIMMSLRTYSHMNCHHSSDDESNSDWMCNYSALMSRENKNKKILMTTNAVLNIESSNKSCDNILRHKSEKA